MGSVFLNDLDDYLAPSVACTNPTFTEGGVKDTTHEKNQPLNSITESSSSKEKSSAVTLGKYNDNLLLEP